MGKSEVFCEDCMVLMARYPDKYFDLAIVDPPYGIGEDGLKNHSRGKCAKPTMYTPKNWDRETITPEYFKQLQRISKNQIIWGANHFISKIGKDSPAWIVWNKLNGENDFADCELAWTSFDCATRMFTFRWAGMLQGDMKNKEERIHPTQKPVSLYKWLLKNYATPDMKILDTHAGSMSSVIACLDGDFNITAFEIDSEYFESGKERILNHIAQCNLFMDKPEINFIK